MGNTRVLINETRGIQVNNMQIYVRTKPYEHQLTAFNEAAPHRDFALLMEQGTGKTLVAIGLMGLRSQSYGVKRILVVAPLSVIPFWKTELSRFANFTHMVVDLTGKKEEERRAQLKAANGLVIALINYESSWRFYKGLVDWNAEMIVCDESQKIKRYKSKQSKAMHYLGDNAIFKLIMTGTPVTQSPMDIWSQYRFLKPKIFGDNFFRFRRRFAVMGGWQNKQIVSYRHVEELATRAHAIAYRVTKSDALTLPPQVDEELKIPLSSSGQRLYTKLKEEFAILLDSGAVVTVPIVLTQLLRLQQITGGFIKTNEGDIEEVDNTKLNELKQLLEDLPQGKKVVIFCRFVPEILAIAEMARKLQRKVITFYGATKDRGAKIKTFQEDPTVTIFLAQVQTGSLGITLTAADTMIFYSTTFGYADYEQARARVHRVGQTATSVTYIHLLAKDTIDEDILAALREKRDVAEYIVDRLKRGTTQKYI